MIFFTLPFGVLQWRAATCALKTCAEVILWDLLVKYIWKNRLSLGIVCGKAVGCSPCLFAFLPPDLNTSGRATQLPELDQQRTV